MLSPIPVFFGRITGYSGQPAASRTVHQSLSCTLEELFNGVDKRVEHVKLVLKDGKPVPVKKELIVHLGKGWKEGSTV